MQTEEDKRDELLVTNINRWVNNEILSLEFDPDQQWDIYCSLHDSNFSIVQIGSTVYKPKDANHSNSITEFLEDDLESDDDDCKGADALSVEIEKIHQYRIVFDFTDYAAFDESDNSVSLPTPLVSAVYQKKAHGAESIEWQQIFCNPKFNDEEIDQLCSNEQDLDDPAAQCDLSVLFQSLSQKQLVRGIQSFWKRATPQSKQLLQRQIVELRHVQTLAVHDKELIMIIIAKVIAVDGEDILAEFDTVIDTDVEKLWQVQFRQNMLNLRNEISELNLGCVLDDVEELVKKAYSLCQRKQSESALQMIENVCQQFLIEFLVCVVNICDEDIDLANHRKVMYRISDLETCMEAICGQISDAQMLRNTRSVLQEWQKQLLPIFGPLFADNLRKLKSDHSTAKNTQVKRKLKDIDDIQHNVKATKKRRV